MAFRVVKIIATRRNTFKLSTNQILSCRPYSQIPSFLANTPSAVVTILPSGVRVASSDALGDVATIGLYVAAGSANETDQQSGVANFLQNLSLKGTSKRSKSQLDKDIEHIGANLTGYTSRENTAFLVQAVKSDVPKAVQILSEIIQNTDFKDDQIEKTRSLIQKEQSVLRSKVESAIIDHVHSAAYQGSSYALAPIGESSVVKSLQKLHLIEFQKKYYTSQNLLLVGTGAVSHDELVSLAKTHLSGLPSSSQKPSPIPTDYVGSEIRIRDDTVHVVKSVFAYEGVGRQHPHYWSFLVLKTLFSNWSRNSGTGIYQSSRLAEIVSMEKLVQEIRTVYIPYAHTGLFAVYSETTSDKIEDFTYEFYNTVQKMATYINEHELLRAKNQLKVELLSHYENQILEANNIAETVFSCSRAIPIGEIYSRVDAIQLTDVQAVLGTYLTDVDPVVVSHGPIENLPDYNVIRNWTYWNRW